MFAGRAGVGHSEGSEAGVPTGATAGGRAGWAGQEEASKGRAQDTGAFQIFQVA